jgi:hypothetical protein
MAAFMLLAVLITGCNHKTPAAPPVAAQAPPLPPHPVDQVASLPPVPQPETPQVGPPGSDKPPEPPPEKPHRTTHHKPKPATAPATSDQSAKEAPKETPPPAATTQQAAAGEASAVSPIGQLTTTGESAGTPSRHDILDTIAATEKNLNEIKRPLTAQEQETATQIRTFLTKAKQALTQDDLDGAQTLSTKAKVLLEELTKS